MNSFLKDIKSGVVWSFISQGGGQIFNLLVTFILARLLSPEEFGIIGMITVFTGFASIFISFGFGAALIQKKNHSFKDIDTIFFINVCSGFFFMVLFFLIAPAIANFYDRPILINLTRVLSPIFLITALSGVNKVLIIKKLDFKLNTIIMLISTGISSLAAIILAYLGYSVWSILIKILLHELIVTIFFLFLFPINQKFRFYKESFNSMLKMGSNVAGVAILNYWSRNADNLIIGKMLGDGPLGVYTKSYSIMLLPLKNISSVIGKVMFPSFSLIQDNILEVKSLYLKATKLIAFISFPMMIGLSLVAEPFVLVTFGENWLEMVPVLSVLSLLGASQSILTLNGSIYNSLGKAHIAFRISLVLSFVTIIGFIIGVKYYGLMGLVMAYALTGTLGAIPSFYFAGKLISVSIIDLFKNLLGSIICTAIMSFFVWLLIKILNPIDISPLFELIILSLSGMIIYIGSAYLFKLEEIKLLKRIWKIK